MREYKEISNLIWILLMKDSKIYMKYQMVNKYQQIKEQGKNPKLRGFPFITVVFILFLASAGGSNLAGQTLTLN